MTEPQEPGNSTKRLPTVDPVEHGGAVALDQSASAASYDPAPTKEGGGSAGRFWSARRIPAGLVALVVPAAPASCCTTWRRYGPTIRRCGGAARSPTNWRNAR